MEQAGDGLPDSAARSTTARRPSRSTRLRSGATRTATSRLKPADPFANVVIPTGPRSNIPQRSNNFFPGQRPRKLPTNLPEGLVRRHRPDGPATTFTTAAATRNGSGPPRRLSRLPSRRPRRTRIRGAAEHHRQPDQEPTPRHLGGAHAAAIDDAGHGAQAGKSGVRCPWTSR